MKRGWGDLLPLVKLVLSLSKEGAGGIPQHAPFYIKTQILRCYAPQNDNPHPFVILNEVKDLGVKVSCPA